MERERCMYRIPVYIQCPLLKKRETETNKLRRLNRNRKRKKEIERERERERGREREIGRKKAQRH